MSILYIGINGTCDGCKRKSAKNQSMLRENQNREQKIEDKQRNKRSGNITVAVNQRSPKYNAKRR